MIRLFAAPSFFPLLSTSPPPGTPVTVKVIGDGSGGTGAVSSYQAASRSLDSLIRGRQAEPPDRMLEGYCGRGVTVRRMVQRSA